MSSRILALLSVAGLAAATACGDILGSTAALETVTDTTVVYAVNGAPPSAPTALHLFSATVVPATGTFQFDVAFDIDSTGKVKIIPNPNLASALVGAAHPVALLVSDKDFDSIKVAPSGGYHADTVQVVSPGTTVVIQSQDQLACSSSFVGTTLYGKVVVDSIHTSSRLLFIRFESDPNCGFRSFASGLPPFSG